MTIVSYSLGKNRGDGGSPQASLPPFRMWVISSTEEKMSDGLRPTWATANHHLNDRSSIKRPLKHNNHHGPPQSQILPSPLIPSSAPNPDPLNLISHPFPLLLFCWIRSLPPQHHSPPRTQRPTFPPYHNRYIRHRPRPHRLILRLHWRTPIDQRSDRPRKSPSEIPVRTPNTCNPIHPWTCAIGHGYNSLQSPPLEPSWYMNTT